MAGITNFLANALINQHLRGIGYTFPTTIYFALGTAAADDGTFTELTYTGYARVAYAQGSGNWAAPTIGQSAIALGSALDFPTRTDAGATQTATVFGIFDAPTGGNLLNHGVLISSVSVNQNEKPFIDDADIIVNYNAN